MMFFVRITLIDVNLAQLDSPKGSCNFERIFQYHSWYKSLNLIDKMLRMILFYRTNNKNEAMTLKTYPISFLSPIV